MLFRGLHFGLMFTGAAGVDAAGAIALQLQVPFAPILAAIPFKDYPGWRRGPATIGAFVGAASLPANQEWNRGSSIWRLSLPDRRVGLPVRAISNIQAKAVGCATPPGVLGCATPPGVLGCATPPGVLGCATPPGVLGCATPPGVLGCATPPGVLG